MKDVWISAMARFCENCGKEYNIYNEEVFDNPPHLKCKNCEDIIFLEKMPAAVVNVKSKNDISNIQKPIRLLIVDDSKIIRKALRAYLSSDPIINIIGEAENGQVALEMIPRLKPDVITLDINMPVMNGITTLKHIMIKHPVPTLMFSTLTKEGARISFDAIKLGALGFLQKPVQNTEIKTSAQFQNMIKKIRLASQVEMNKIQLVRIRSKLSKPKQSLLEACNALVVMGAAEGGYSALLKVIPRLSQKSPVAYIISIYAEKQHVDSFSSYLKNYSDLTIATVVNKDIVKNGVCYLCSHKDDITLVSDADGIKFNLKPKSDAVFMDTIDKLMISTSEIMQHKSVGVILSGTGQDGTEGLKSIQKYKGICIVQDPKTCFAKAMAYSAINQTKVDHIYADGDIALKLSHILAKI